MAYTMKEFAELFQISEHTVRYYTDIHIPVGEGHEGVAGGEVLRFQRKYTG